MKKSATNPSFGIHNLYTASKGRRDCLTGEWSALVWPQKVPGVPREIQVRFLFDANQKVVTGEMSFASFDKSRGLIENYLVGGFHSETTLEFTYAKKEDGVIGWGHLFCKLALDARKMDARITGISSHTGNHFYSEALLIKGKKLDLNKFSILKREKPTVFIGHGKTNAWRDVKRHIEKLGYPVETFESGTRAGRNVSDVLGGMLADSSFAVLIMTGEDKTGDGRLRARQNVIHEIGFFQGKLGIHRAIILRESKVESFGNIDGITHIEFNRHKVRSACEQIAATIKREFPEQ